MAFLSPTPLVSVIIPVYNCAQYLAEALTSVFAQDYQPCEVIVIDDGSTDNSAAIAQSFPVRYLSQPNQGAAGARNTAVAAATGEVLAFLDADDVWLPTKVRKQVGCLQQHPEVGMVFCHLTPKLAPGKTWPTLFNQQYLLSNPPAFMPSSMLIRQSVWTRVGPFDSQYQCTEDLDWIRRAWDLGITHITLAEVLFQRGIHDAHLSFHQAGPQELVHSLRASLKRRSGTS